MRQHDVDAILLVRARLVADHGLPADAAMPLVKAAATRHGTSVVEFAHAVKDGAIALDDEVRLLREAG